MVARPAAAGGLVNMLNDVANTNANLAASATWSSNRILQTKMVYYKDDFKSFPCISRSIPCHFAMYLAPQGQKKMIPWNVAIVTLESCFPCNVELEPIISSKFHNEH